MAIEHGLGVTPWSPLKSGVLSGKYTRENQGKHKSDRAMFLGGLLDQSKTYDVIEAVTAVAKERGTTPARVALAWVQGQRGVASTILGARTVAQLDDNLDALDVKLEASDREKLDAVSKPTLNFPAAFLSRAHMFMHAGITVNGASAPPSPMTPKSDAERY